MADIRDTYRTWADVPESIRTAVDAYDAARRGGTTEPPMSERNKTSIAPMIEAAILAAAGEPAPIPMLLFCPNCGAQHVDAPDFVPDPGGGDLGVAMKVAADRASAWTNPPHRSHLCGSCGCIWRPADVPTEGAAKIVTRGKADTWDFHR